jgi:hypothetical protein
MNGLLENAVYTAHVNKWRSAAVLPPTTAERLHGVLVLSREMIEKVIGERDLAPLIGTTTGMLVGGLTLVLFFSLWYLVLCHRHRKNAKRREYARALGMMSRPTSDDSQYQRLRPCKKTKKPSLWQQLLRKTYFRKNELPTITGPACYLVWEPELNNGQLVQLYSKTPLSLTSDERCIVAVWKPKSHISSTKYENDGRTVLIGNCTVGFQGKHNYCHGVCQFLKSTFPCGGGSVTLLENADIAVDVYLYLNDTRNQFQTCFFPMRTSWVLPGNTLAVACLPKSTAFYKSTTVDMYTWLADGERKGSSVRF